jgi:hypothetical protein
MHESIRTFTRKGICGDEANLVHDREEQIRWVEAEMRDYGYAPVLDMDPQFNRWYDEEQDRFEFKLTMYGTYVGKEAAWQVAGLMHGVKIMKSIVPSKLKQS